MSESLKTVIEWAMKRRDVLILAKFSRNEEDPDWGPYLMIPEAKLPLIEPFGGNKAGFLVHAMICALGVWGFLEKLKRINPDEWEASKNSDAVSSGSVYRFKADLDESAIIPGTELEPSDSTNSSTYSVLSTEEVYHSLPGTSIATLNGDQASKDSFRPAVQTRDGNKCVLSNVDEDRCKAAHLIKSVNTHYAMDQIVLKRHQLGGEDANFWATVKGPFDVRVGLFLSFAIRNELRQSCLGTYRVPNFGMKSLTEAADDIHIRSSHSEPPDQNPKTALTEAALRQFSKTQVAPAEWAGTKSSVYLVPFDQTAREYAAHRSGMLKMSFEPCPIRVPRDAKAAADWPPNLCFDWAWGGRILKAFGSYEAREYAKRSPLATLVNELRRKRKREEPAEDERPTKRWNNSNSQATVEGTDDPTNSDIPEEQFDEADGNAKDELDSDEALGRNVQEVTLSRVQANKTFNKVQHLRG
ncbi:hypothetical protein BD410DRAFT_831354 [Rickenella mellea]|uniref:Uncharacterized protein n=1 Tax=Rickenella mellea TaxID=50990 RepID=A0A4Y7PRW1_9AGAM|nr:hypothetical protein BD410DRAFT_831354 [Rickenella mellea]